MSKRRQIAITQEQQMEIAKVIAMNTAFRKCAPQCLKSQYYTSSVPTSRERRCLSDCFQTSTFTSALFLNNNSKIMEQARKFLKAEKLNRAYDPMNFDDLED
jgi:hypothetical protein